MSITLQAGQWYRTRGGKIRYCVGKGPLTGDKLQDSFPWLCIPNVVASDTYWYSDKGEQPDTSEDWDIVEHLPDCTGFDWVPKPKLQLREGAWYERRDGEVVGPCNSTGIDDRPWAVGSYFYRHDGKNGGHEDVHLIREVDPPKPKYRAFKNGTEYQPERERWLRHKQDGYLARVTVFNDKHIWIGALTVGTSYELAMETFDFMDGTPFGVLDE